MGPSAKCHPPEGEECKTSVEHRLPVWAEPAVGYYSRQPRPSPMWGSRFVGARAVGLWVGEQKFLGKTPRRGNPSPQSTYLPTSSFHLPLTPLFLHPRPWCPISPQRPRLRLRGYWDNVQLVGPRTVGYPVIGALGSEESPSG